MALYGNPNGNPQQVASLARELQNRLWNGKQNLADTAAMFVPGIGNVLSGVASAGSFSRGDVGGGILNALGVLPGYGNLVGGAAKLGRLAALSRKINPTAAGQEALDLTLSGVSRSTNPMLSLPGKLLHPTEVAMGTGRAYGPGTYFAKNRGVSDEAYREYGNILYSLKPDNAVRKKILEGKGYINQAELSARMGVDNTRALQELGGMKWDSPLVQDLLKEGYVGVQADKMFTNWLLGAEKGLKLRPGIDLKGILKPKSSKAKPTVSNSVAPPVLRGGPPTSGAI
jgi:hypothetical protein